MCIQFFKNMKVIWAVGDSYTRENMGVAMGSADFKISLEEETIIAFTTFSTSFMQCGFMEFFLCAKMLPVTL